MYAWLLWRLMTSVFCTEALVPLGLLMVLNWKWQCFTDLIRVISLCTHFSQACKLGDYCAHSSPLKHMYVILHFVLFFLICFHYVMYYLSFVFFLNKMNLELHVSWILENKWGILCLKLEWFRHSPTPNFH